VTSGALEAGLDSPLGPLCLVASAGAPVALDWRKTSRRDADPALRVGLAWLAAYFARSPLPAQPSLAPSGPSYCQAVWQVMQQIPYGRTLSYGTVARRLALDPRVVGQACGANPLPLLVPCHRIVGADGLGGYSGAGGVAAKRFLLRHEGALPPDLFA